MITIIIFKVLLRSQKVVIQFGTFGGISKASELHRSIVIKFLKNLKKLFKHCKRKTIYPGEH